LLFLTGYLIGIKIVPVLDEFVHRMARPTFFLTPIHSDDQFSLWCVFWFRTLKIYVEFLLRNWSTKKKKKKPDFSTFLNLRRDVCSDLEPWNLKWVLAAHEQSWCQSNIKTLA
jgi:hypothetical protein